VRDLGGSEAAMLAVYGRFLVPDDAQLDQFVERMPSDARQLWAESLERCSVPDRWPECDRQSLLNLIGREARPVAAEGHLFELLVRELDASARRRRGVYFTPRPLVEFIVRSVSRLIREHFTGRRCHLIDPACGYGAFLFEAAKARPLVAAMHGMTGIELCKATWAVAHLLLTLDPSQEPPVARLLNANPLLAGESLRDAILGPPGNPLVPVILGNPPWSNFGRQNRSPWIGALLSDYRRGLSERKSNLADDAIKFLRWGQYWIDQAGAGILAFVTPNTWLAGLTHRRMRQSLLESFDELLVLDLHGEPGASAGDENVFGIRSGVAIVVMVKRPGSSRSPLRARSPENASLVARQCRVEHSHIVGSRAAKLAALGAGALGAVSLTPGDPNWRLTPATSERSRRRPSLAYASFWPLDRIFRHYISAVQTKNDGVFVGFTPQDLEQQVRTWLAQRIEPIEFDAEFIRPYLVAPFDRRWIYYDPRLLGRPRWSVMRHMLRPNLGLVFMRQATGHGEYDHFLAVDCLVSDRVFYSRHGAPFLAPLWVEDSEFRVQGSEGEGKQATSNLDQQFLDAVAAAVGTSDREPLETFHYVYAVAYSPLYRRLFGGQLRRGFPRFPLPRDGDAFKRLADLGGRLVHLHVSDAAPVADEAGGSDASFHVGGYDVLHRWQVPRKRQRVLIDEAELTRLAWIGRETRRLMHQIDAVGMLYDCGSPHPPPPGVSMVKTSPG
jgi:hypothetical protein